MKYGLKSILLAIYLQELKNRFLLQTVATNICCNGVHGKAIVPKKFLNFQNVNVELQ